MNKKLKKLIREPKLFFSDMLSKRKIVVQKKNIAEHGLNDVKKNAAKTKTRYSYEIVVVVNEKVSNLERCMSSIYEQQDLDFENINVTILDLGVNEEQTVYISSLNENVKVFSVKEELGYLSFTSSLQQNYTLFIWGDDFLDMTFFKATDDFLLSDSKKVRRGSIICSAVLTANSNSEVGRNFNPITALHSKLSVDNMLPEQMAVDSIYGCLFPSGVLKAILRKQGGFYTLKFDGIGLFFDIFRSLPETRRITISTKSKYLVHEENISNPFKENSWSEPVLFTEYFILLGDKFKLNIPGAKKWQDFLRRSLFYMLLKYIKKGLVNQSLLDNLSNDEKNKFLESFKETMQLIGKEVINKFNISCAEQFKVGCLNIIGKERISNAVDILQYDIDKNMFMLRYYTSSLLTECFIIGSKDIIPCIDKNISHNLFGEVFFVERVAWLSASSDVISKPLSIKLNNRLIKMRGLDKKVVNSITPVLIKRQHINLKPKFKPSSIYRDAWIFMDRDNQADDNAEHLYRYVHNTRPDIPAWFVLQKESHDWQRLSDEGFKLLAFGEAEHEKALESCSRVISSHAAQFATDYFKDKRMTWKKFIFLQHGVIHNDQSALFKPDWKKFDLFVTSAIGEYKSIVDDMSPYKFTPKEVALTGLPRHDALINSEIESEKIILVMPTWRPSLLGKVISGTERELLPDFVESEYATTWYNFLSNDKLKYAAESSGYKIIFFPHANIQPYLDKYTLPEHVTVLSHSSGSIQELFLRASIMITDYSSVAFEMAYLNKPVCYYQFDEDDFFNKGHYNKGYYSYRENGFGPVYNDEYEVVDFIIKTIANNCIMHSSYALKANVFFPYRDGLCCERTVAAIESLDKKELSDSVFSDSDYVSGRAKTAEWALKAYEAQNMIIANRRYSSIFSEKDGEEQFEKIDNKYIVNYIDVLTHLGYIDRAIEFIQLASKLPIDQSLKLRSQINLVKNILMESDGVITLQDNDIEGFYYNLFFSEGCSLNKITNNNFLRECDEVFLQLYNENPMSAVNYISENISSFDFVVINHTILMYRVFELSGHPEYIIRDYPKLSMLDKQNILVKFIYLRSLYKLNKWSVIQKYIGLSSILQGRTSIPLFASCYFFSMRGAHLKIKNIDDFAFLFLSPSLLKENYRLDVLKYFLYIDKDLQKVKLFIDECFETIPVRIIEDYLYRLCSDNFTKESYDYFKRINVSKLSSKSLELFGELAMSYGEYETAVACFQQACLLKLPIVDHEMKSRLATARIWANEDTRKVLTC
ncbi:CDP-glycerol glycerophosphotransferase family protein [Kluyvera genomosp. 1]|uniref:CDP-glycerol glycerophosphotransferase family protein n=1 Tax=Kluyvera genomosp. 1 TaxID=2774053 RepID=UPI00068BA9BA|nr:CDP-glycerol glycerophosphotransferase family protein [Kluyvera genomosp. 1]